MNQETLTISEDLYQRIKTNAQLRGVSIEQLLEEWEQRDREIERRQEAGREIKAFFAEMKTKYGLMPDSAELVREDRDSR